MFNYESINKEPNVFQVKAIIEYMEKDLNNSYNFLYMMKLHRVEDLKIILDLNNAHCGKTYEILFNEKYEIISFTQEGIWMS